MIEIPAGLLEWARLPGPALVLQEVRGRAAKGVRTRSVPMRDISTPSSFFWSMAKAKSCGKVLARCTSNIIGSASSGDTILPPPRRMA